MNSEPVGVRVPHFEKPCPKSLLVTVYWSQETYSVDQGDMPKPTEIKTITAKKIILLFQEDTQTGVLTITNLLLHYNIIS